MQKYISLFFCLSSFLLACNKSDAPDGVIEQNRMTNLLTEVHMTDGTMYNVRQDKDSLYKFGLTKYMYVFKKYGTDSAHFRKSMKYYSADPPVMLEIYTKVLDNLKCKADSLNKIIYKSAVNKNAIPSK